MPTISLKKEECFEGFHSRYVSIGDNTEKERDVTIQTSDTVTIDEEDGVTATNTPAMEYKPTELNETTTA